MTMNGMKEPKHKAKETTKTTSSSLLIKWSKIDLSKYRICFKAPIVNGMYLD